MPPSPILRGGQFTLTLGSSNFHCIRPADISSRRTRQGAACWQPIWLLLHCDLLPAMRRCFANKPQAAPRRNLLY